jgi:hypothetical protein
MSAADPRARLMELVSAQGVSLAGLSALIGRNPSYLQQFVRKGSPRKLEEGDRRALARFFGVAEAELGGADDGGEGEYIGARKPAPQWVSVPRLDLSASAGSGAMAEGEATLGHMQFAPRWLRRQDLDPALLSIIEVEGDSMEPTLRDGDEILVDRTPRPVRAGIHVVRVDDALLVKRLERAGDRLRLISDNQAYPPIERPAADVEVLGRVVWKGGRL